MVIYNPHWRNEMIEIKGQYSEAKVFTDNIEESAQRQVKNLCDQEFTQDLLIRIMPDVHTGYGCPIGTTMTIKDKIVPNLVGVDIGCGMETVVLKRGSYSSKRFNPEMVDKIIRNEIPFGLKNRNDPHKMSGGINLKKLRCPDINIPKALNGIGSLGSGNHFIEFDKDEEDNLYLVIHSGSRHLGNSIAIYYQGEANKMIKEKGLSDNEGEVKKLAYLEGDLFNDYINDMEIIQKYADLNRRAISEVILEGLGIKKIEERFSTIHNYIDIGKMILRKGSVSSLSGERLLIPFNMRDGSIICEGKGNPDWNYSAPHGAGRIMSRKAAFESLDMKKYKKEMEGIYSSCVTSKTLDESPMAYKDMNEIIENIKPSANIIKIIKPIYNFKAMD
jgi:RNA-splicing ligase RtcB